ncbi:hypothetical protein [Mangrovibacillus cuniculi]|uniref:Uncharacterized protein n=1 Tax=Mangrovibacillus cuniculi TaxID=2593652 RepID=A0A7S8C935_9BACI|nr:hypothetical protein [Mangrovibacillus cuniculi]QPC45588.1 hypothetical protein G8O30_00650 [Mangrovibacillus cuniculi]
MKKEIWNIDYPDEQMTKSQIDEIVRKGVKKPRSFLSTIKEMYQQVGVRNLFHDAMDLSFIFIIGFSLLLIGLFYTVEQVHSMNEMYTILFISSPLLYLGMAVLSFVRANEHRTFEVEMTCKYHILQLAAFRMLVFGIGAIVCNGLFIVALSYFHPTLHTVEALCISMSSLSIFATSFLYMSQKVKRKWGSYAFIGVWVIGNMTAVFYSAELYTMFLRHIPMYAYMLIFLLFAYGYVERLKDMMFHQPVKGVL